MTTKKLGKQSFAFTDPPSITGFGNSVGKKEGQGPLRAYFDHIAKDDHFGQKTWEAAESVMQEEALAAAMKSARLGSNDTDFLFGGDLLNQCIATTYCARQQNIPFFGLYGACSTMAEGLILASMAIDGHFGSHGIAITSSHFCTAERQYRTPLEYGSQRSPTAQWTATGSGAVALSAQGKGPYITHATVGKIIDKGIQDVSNMGAAMAPAAYTTLRAHMEDTGRNPDYYDLIVTGDLGVLGKQLVLDLFSRDGTPLSNFDDCGVMLYDLIEQDVHAGASGCGCSAIVLTGYLLREMQAGRFSNILFCGTGALHSPTSILQGESIPGICHAVSISTKKGATHHGCV